MLVDSPSKLAKAHSEVSTNWRNLRVCLLDYKYRHTKPNSKVSEVGPIWPHLQHGATRQFEKREMGLRPQIALQSLPCVVTAKTAAATLPLYVMVCWKVRGECYKPAKREQIVSNFCRRRGPISGPLQSATIRASTALGQGPSPGERRRNRGNQTNLEKLRYGGGALHISSH